VTLSSFLEIFISPPSIYIDRIRQALREDVAVGAQNCYLKTHGAYTGEIAYDNRHELNSVGIVHLHSC